jgi:hypothetical protein
MNRTEQMANEAVYILQMNYDTALRYVCHNAEVSRNVAKQALDSVLSFWKK